MIKILKSIFFFFILSKFINKIKINKEFENYQIRNFIIIFEKFTLKNKYINVLLFWND